LSIFLLISSVTVFVLASWWSQNPPMIQQNGGNWFCSTFVNPLSNWLFRSGLVTAGQTAVILAPVIIAIGVIFLLLLFISIWINKKIIDRNKLQYQIHYLIKAIGLNSTILQIEGWE